MKKGDINSAHSDISAEDLVGTTIILTLSQTIEECATVPIDFRGKRFLQTVNRGIPLGPPCR